MALSLQILQSSLNLVKLHVWPNRSGYNVIIRHAWTVFVLHRTLLWCYPHSAYLLGSASALLTLLQDTWRVCIPVPHALSSTSSCSVLFLSVPESGVQGPHGEVSQWNTVNAWVPQTLHCSRIGAGKHPFPSVFTKHNQCNIVLQLQRQWKHSKTIVCLLT